jgi:hypothetical protein
MDERPRGVEDELANGRDRMDQEEEGQGGDRAGDERQREVGRLLGVAVARADGAAEPFRIRVVEDKAERSRDQEEPEVGRVGPLDSRPRHVKTIVRYSGCSLAHIPFCITLEYGEMIMLMTDKF